MKYNFSWYTLLVSVIHHKLITFTDEPHVHMVGKVGMVHAGEMLHLNCTATGIPKPDISWYRNKKRLQKSKNSRNFTLEIKFLFMYKSLSDIPMSRTISFLNRRIRSFSIYQNNKRRHRYFKPTDRTHDA